MDRANVKLWGRQIELNISFDYYDEPIPSYMVESIDALLASWNVVNEALSAVRDYCESNDGDSIILPTSPSTEDWIYSYVQPTTIAALDNDKVHSVLLLCDYEFDLEDGLAILFENEQLVSIGPMSDYL